MPFVDLHRIHAPLKAAILGDIAALVDSGAFANGPAVAEFEEAFAAFCGTPHAVGVGAGSTRSASACSPPGSVPATR